MTKQQEINLWAKIITDLPNPGAEYLRPILCGISKEVAEAIRNDFTVIDFVAFEREQKERKAELDRLNTEVANAQRRLDSINFDLQLASNLRDDARSKLSAALRELQ